jgi:hypothetical protein
MKVLNSSGGTLNCHSYGECQKRHHYLFRYLVQIQDKGGTWWDSWLRHYATSWKVAGSIPDEVIGFFN